MQNPVLPPHRQRVTDVDGKKEKRAERIVYTLFYLSIAGSLGAVLAYMFFPIETGELIAIRLQTMFVGISMTLALLAIGIGAVHWAKALMADHESIEERHPVAGRQPGRLQHRLRQQQRRAPGRAVARHLQHDRLGRGPAAAANRNPAHPVSRHRSHGARTPHSNPSLTLTPERSLNGACA